MSTMPINIPAAITNREDYVLDKETALKKMHNEPERKYLFYKSTLNGKKDKEDEVILTLCIRCNNQIARRGITIKQIDNNYQYSGGNTLQQAVDAIVNLLIKEGELAKGTVIDLAGISKSTHSEVTLQLNSKLLTIPDFIQKRAEFCLLNHGKISRSSVISLIRDQAIGYYILYQSVQKTNTATSVDLTCCVKSAQGVKRYAITINKMDDQLTYNNRFNKLEDAIQDLKQHLIKENLITDKTELTPFTQWKTALAAKESLAVTTLAQTSVTVVAKRAAEDRTGAEEEENASKFARNQTNC